MSKYYGAIEVPIESAALFTSNSTSSETKNSNPFENKNKKQPSTSQRAVTACDNCRRKKIRCSGGSSSGSCESCTATRVECTYLSTSTKRAPPKGYVESLEKRIESLEEIIRTFSASSGRASLTQRPSLETSSSCEEMRKALGLEPDQGASPISFESNSDDTSPTGGDTGILGEGEDSLKILTADMEELCVDSDRYVGRGSGPHLMRTIEDRFNKSKEVIREPCRLQNDTGHPLVEMLLLKESQAKILSFPLPPLELANSLVDAYFTNINDNFSLLHRPSFNRACSAGVADSDGSFRSLLFMIMAIGARFVNDPRIPAVAYSSDHPHGVGQSRGYYYFKAACETNASPILIQSASLYAIQSSVLSVLWLSGCGSPIAAWISVNSALSRVIDVGVHREARSRWTRSPLENQLRKRAFCTLFILDRSLSVTLGRPLSIQESDVDLVEPLDISDEDLDEWNTKGGPPPPPSTIPSSVSATNALYTLHKIAGRVLLSLFATTDRNGPLPTALAAAKVSELDSMLNEWLTSLPEHLRWKTGEQDPRWLVLQSTLYTTYYFVSIFIHRDFISASNSLPAFPSLAICSNAARSTIHIVDQLRQNKKLEQLYFSIPLQCATSGLILLVSVTSSKTGLSSTALADVNKCIAALEILTKSTWIASKCAFGISKFTALARANVDELNAKDLNASSRKRAPEQMEGSTFDSNVVSPTSTNLSDRSNSHSTPEVESRAIRTKLSAESNPLMNDLFAAWSNPSPAQPLDSLPNYNLLSPSTTAMLDAANPSPYVYTPGTRYGMPETGGSGVGIFGNNYQFPFEFEANGMQGVSDGSEWAFNGFDFDAFSQNFVA